MKKKTIWLLGSLLFLILLGLSWNTITGKHGLGLQILVIFLLVNAFSLILAFCIVKTAPNDPNIVPTYKPPKMYDGMSEEEFKKTCTGLKILFFPITGLVYGAKFKHKRRIAKRERNIRIIDGFHWYW